MKNIINKTSIIKGFLLGSTLLFVGCKDSMDEINLNPNSPEQVITPGLMNSATKGIIDVTRSGFHNPRLTLPWMQYSAQINYTTEDRFQYRRPSELSLYSGLMNVANDYRDIINYNTDPVKKSASSVYGKNENQIAVARIMLSYLYSILVDSFGPVPYYSYGSDDPDFQGLDIEKYPNPVYASQEKIYTDILKELKEASEQLDVSQNGFDGDQIYNGNMAKWKKFANSLRLRVANRVKGVVPTAQEYIQDAIKSGVMQSNDDNAVLVFPNSIKTPAPIFGTFYVDARADFKITNTMVDVLKGVRGPFKNLDPRLFKYAAPVYAVDASDNYIVDKDGNKTVIFPNPSSPPFTYNESKRVENYVGMPYGIPDGMTSRQTNAGTSFWSNQVIKADFGEVFMEYSEVEFLLSEQNGWDQTHYENGVRASMQKWGVANEDIEKYVTAMPKANQANVLGQKWIALFMQPQEAYAEWRRTGYPDFLIKPGETVPLVVPDADGSPTYQFKPLNGLTEIPARIRYPDQLRQLNPTGYQSGLKGLGAGGDELTTKLIWDKN